MEWTWPDIEGVLLVSHSVADTFRCNRQISEKHERGGKLLSTSLIQTVSFCLLQQHHTRQTKQAEHGLSWTLNAVRRRFRRQMLLDYA